MADIIYGPAMSPNAANATLPAARTNFELPNLADQVPQIDQRPPTDSDGINVGLGQSALWRWGQWVYQAQTNTSGDPEWLLLNPQGSPLPGDAASVAPVGVWGLKQLKAAYTGNLFIAQGADSTQVTVGQLSDGSPDIRTMLATLGNDLPIRVAKVFDQSGNGNDIVQATAANQPLLLMDKDGELFVVFDPWVGSAGDTAFARWLTIPITLSLTAKNAVSAYNVSEVLNIGNTGVNLLLLGGGSGTGGLQLISFPAQGVTLTFDGGAGGWHSGAPSISYIITSTAGRTYGVDGYTSHTTTGNIGTAPLTGGTIGMYTGAASNTITTPMSETAWRMSVVFNSTLSAANDLAVRTAISVRHKTRPQAGCNIVIAGESVTTGRDAPGNTAWVKQLQDSLPHSVRVINQGISGQGVSANGESGSNSMVGLYSTAIAPVYVANARCNIAVLFPGANDGFQVSPNTTADEIAAINTWVADAKATGFNPVFVCTLIDRVGTTPEATWLAAMSPLIRSNAAANGYNVIDVQAIAAVGAPGAASNATFFPDGAHPVGPALYSIMAVVRAALAPYISP